jgi:cation-transporting ATPase I
VSLGKAVIEELRNPLTPLLTVGAGLAAAVGSVADAALILGVLGLNALIGGLQAVRTESAIGELRETNDLHVCVRRDGQEILVDRTEVVPGDVVVLRGGDPVPADCRILDACGLEVDESSLTGESLPVRKHAEPSFADAVAERRSMLYQGTSIATGTATAVAVAVGDMTEARRGAREAHGAKPAGGVEARLEALTSFMAPVAVAGGAILGTANVMVGRPAREVLANGVSLAVAAVPEGLPMLAMVAQLGAARRLSERGVLVRHPRAIEALGRVAVICVDKTGTVTEGKIRLHAVSDGRRTQRIDALDDAGRRAIAAGLRASPASVANHAFIHPTDRALLEGAADASVAAQEGCGDWRRLSELPFEPARGFHAVVGRSGDAAVMSVKGAPEVILLRCRDHAHASGTDVLDAEAREHLAAETNRLAREGFRVLAVAERELPLDAALGDESVRDLTFLGFLAFTDPVRPAAAAAVRALREAGAEVIMVTGDHPSTAAHIAGELGLLDHGAITGAELDEIDEPALDARLADARVFARVTPAHKVRIVKALQRAGRVVAMTGDGANDAPAIRLANVGIALGVHAAPAAREAADIIIMDDRIETIIDAVLEGRAMWAAVRDAASLMVGGNLGEVLFTVGAGVAGGVSPFNARQLLLANLLTDVAPAMAIALRPPLGMSPAELLREGPDASLGSALTRDIAWRAAIQAGAATGGWLVARPTGTAARAGTVALVSLVGTHLGQTLLAGGRSPLVLGTSVASMAALAAVIQTPGISQFFGCTPLGPVGWATAATAGAVATMASALLPGVLSTGRLLWSGEPSPGNGAASRGQRTGDESRERLPSAATTAAAHSRLTSVGTMTGRGAASPVASDTHSA